MIKLIGLFLLISYTSSGVLAQTDDIIFRRISPPEGFTFGSVHCIEEDANGFIWFGSEYGLFKYDSRNIEKYIHHKDDPNSLPANIIYEVHKDQTGRLWVGTINGVSYFNDESNCFITPRFTVKDNEEVNFSVRSMIENSNGELYTLFVSHLCRIDLHNNSIIPLKIELNSREDFPTSAIFDHQDNLWIGTNSGYLYRSTPPYTAFSPLYHQRKDRIQSILFDNNTIWLGYELSGIDHINSYGTIIQHYSEQSEEKFRLPGNSIRSIVKDPENRIWIGTYNGLVIINKNDLQVITEDNYNNLPHNSIRTIKADSEGGIWIGTWSGGLAYKGRYDNPFIHFNRNYEENSINNSNVGSFAEDKDGSIWISTDEAGLNRFFRQNKKFIPFDSKNYSPCPTTIKSINFDYNNILWIGTYANGLWSFDPEKEQFRHHDIFQSPRISIYAIRNDVNNLWLGSWSAGLFSYNLATGQLKNYLSNPTDPNSLSSNLIRTLLIDNYGGLWIGTQNGLNYKPKGSDRFTRYFYNKIENERISNDEIFSLYEDSSGKIWIGTGGGGLDIYDREAGKITNISVNQGLAGNNVYGILEDKKGNMWISTENGISCYLPVSESFINFTKEDGLQGNQFKPNAAFSLSSGEFLFGGPNGFNLIDPDKLKENPVPPKVFITDLSINNKKVTPTTPLSPLKYNIHKTDKLILKHQENSLSFSFVANNYNQPYKNNFKYRLINYQNDWIDNGTEGKAIFTKIPPGSYIFEVMGSNNSGVWSAFPTQLNIDISYPFWRSNLAYLVYLLILLISAWLIRREFILRQKLRNQLLVEQVQRENEENLHQMKMQIFTNISHEFRTPLTLILSPLEQIMDKKYYDNDTKEHLTMIQRNARRLRMLINQIIDFRRFELNKVEYNPEKTEIISLCMEICNHFEVHARDKAITFSMTSSFKKYEMEVDPEKLDKILFNLLSNAFKHTPEGGNICLKVEETEVLSHEALSFSTDPEFNGPVLALSVSDSGEGIPSDEIPHIFERFYKRTPGKHHGTGIGLHLCREYSKLHNGAITVSNIPEKGIIFSLLLPLKAKGEVEETKPQVLKSWTSESFTLTKDPDIPSAVLASKKELSISVLVVEDNSDMQKQIRSLLKERYKVIVASNGLQGYEIAREIFPDVIISDVVMPGMDGFELCKKLKDDIMTCHIPVILLTALSETEKQIDGLETGADAYVVKPFDNNLLKAQIKNLIASRERLKKTFTESAEKWADDASLTQRDKNLVERSFQIVEKHLLDPNFSVEHLAENLGVHRSSLHRKMKVLTNQSATEFIRYVRMKKALKLMKEGNLNIDEIGFTVGFNSHSYFSQCFKKLYGVTPTEYMAGLKRP